MNFSALNNQSEDLKMSFFLSPTQVFLCFLLLRANNRSAATKHKAVLFGEGEEGGAILLVTLDDREASASKPLLPPPVFLPTQKPVHGNSST